MADSCKASCELSTCSTDELKKKIEECCCKAPSAGVGAIDWSAMLSDVKTFVEQLAVKVVDEAKPMVFELIKRYLFG